MEGLWFDTLGNIAVHSCRIGLDTTVVLGRGNGGNGINFDFVGGNTAGGSGDAGTYRDPSQNGVRQLGGT